MRFGYFKLIEISCNIIHSGSDNETWESILNFTAYAPVLDVISVINSADPVKG